MEAGKPVVRHVARIFEDVGGYFVCSDGLEYLDARGACYSTKAAALEAAYRLGYTHAVGSGAYRQGASIPAQLPRVRDCECEHQRALAHMKECEERAL